MESYKAWKIVNSYRSFTTFHALQLFIRSKIPHEFIIFHTKGSSTYNFV